MDVRPIEPTGNVYTDSILVGGAWDGNSLTYSFPGTAAEFTGYTEGEPFNNFEGLNAVQQAAVTSILAAISSFTNLVFTQLTGVDAASAVLRFGMTDDTETAFGYYPWTDERAGDTWYRNTGGLYDNPRIGNYAWLTFMHEIGHALGLMHPHESEPPMPTDRDWMAYTVMSYRSESYRPVDGGYTNEAWGFAQTFMTEDIAALQYLYGANFDHNSSDTVYQWDPLTGEMLVNGVGQGAPGANRIFTTVWDGGGTDTYDFSNYPNDPDGLYSQYQFTPGSDRIDLSAIDAVAGGGDDAFSFVGNAAFSGTAGELRAAFEPVHGVWYLEADTDGDAGADLVILAYGSADSPITASDFVL